MSTAHECTDACTHGGAMLSPAQRDAWLELGGYVAAADGISDEEIAALAASATGPEGDGAAALAAIQRGATSSVCPERGIAAAVACDPFIRLQCLSEVFHASSADDCSAAEWERLGQVAGAVLGATKGKVFVELCRAEETVRHLRGALLDA